jgi:hypothetical protein
MRRNTLSTVATHQLGGVSALSMAASLADAAGAQPHAAKFARQKVPGATVLAIPAGATRNKVPVISKASPGADFGTQIAKWNLGDRLGRRIWATGPRAAREGLGDVFGTGRERRQLCNPAVAISAITRVDGIGKSAIDGKRSDRNRV